MRGTQSGVTLIELMTVVVIIAILAAIAYPSYRQYAIRANRTEAKTVLYDIAQGLEKCYTRFNAYKDTNCTVTTALTTPQGHYAISAATLDATTFVLKATPQGGQADDTQCGILSLDDKGVRRERDGAAVVPANKCW